MSTKKGAKCEELELRRGPWTLEEDTLLIHYIAHHGEGRWNTLARCSGLKRTGKSCRLRWLNYLKPDVKRGDLSPEEQFLILDLHSKWGNRWSRIAQYLPGRTDNEIKNYWRTRVQKQAKQLKIDANSATFRDAVRYFWMPRLLEKMSLTNRSYRNTNHPAMSIPNHLQQVNNTCSGMSSPSKPSTSCVELPENVPGEPYDPFIAGLETLDEFNLEMLPTTSGCTADSNGDGFWSMDELWHGKQQEDMAVESSSKSFLWG